MSATKTSFINFLLKIFYSCVCVNVHMCTGAQKGSQIPGCCIYEPLDMGAESKLLSSGRSGNILIN